jgi:ketosteroid isomerase-like protein
MDLDTVVRQFRDAANAFAKGDPAPVKELFSHSDDVMLANPFGPAVVGWTAVSEALDCASSKFRDGKVLSFERIAQYVTPDLASIHELERWRTKVGGGTELSTFDLRVSSTYRREGSTWRLVLRHADPIATADPAGPHGPLRGAAPR